MTMRKCKRCRAAEAEWAWQIIGGEDSFSALGWHYRGFPVTPVCEACRVAIKAELATERAGERP